MVPIIIRSGKEQLQEADAIIHNQERTVNDDAPPTSPFPSPSSSPFPHTFLLQLEWNSTAYIEVGSSHLNLPIYIKDLTKTCFHMIQNPVKVPFKINHHKHITYLGVSKTPNLSLVLFLQLRMRLNKENN